VGDDASTSSRTEARELPMERNVEREERAERGGEVGCWAWAERWRLRGAAAV